MGVLEIKRFWRQLHICRLGEIVPAQNEKTNNASVRTSYHLLVRSLAHVCLMDLWDPIPTILPPAVPHMHDRRYNFVRQVGLGLTSANSGTTLGIHIASVWSVAGADHQLISHTNTQDFIYVEHSYGSFAFLLCLKLGACVTSLPFMPWLTHWSQHK